MKKVSVIGYGFSGRMFHSYLIRLADGLVLDSVVEPDEGKRRQAEAERGVRTFVSVDEMLADGAADLAVIATPHNSHAPLAVKLLSAGLNVVTDKAMCLTTEEADSMLAAAKASGRLLSVFHNRRWDWDFNTVRHVIAQGMIGEFLSAEITVTHGRHGGWRANPELSGGLMYDWASHLVDQAVLLAESKPARVYCDIRVRDGLQEHAKCTISFENGKTCIVEVGGGNGALIPKPHWFVLGTEGTLIKYGVDPQEAAMKEERIETARENPDEKARLVTRHSGIIQDMRLDSVKTSWKSFYQNISDVLNGTGAELAVKPEGVRTVISILEAAMESARTGKAIAPR